METDQKLTAYAPALAESELDYFRAGATSRFMLNGELCYLPGFQHIASSCVLHNVSGMDPEQRPEDWLAMLSSEFELLGASCCRFYLTGHQALRSSLPKHEAFKRVVEIGLLTDFTELDPFAAFAQGELVAIKDEETLDLKRTLYCESSLGPDGHDMQGGLFADFEWSKCHAGYMESFLYWHEGRVKGAVSLALKNNFARLKNLYVSPNYRAKGIAKQVVWLLMRKAIEKGAKAFGTYAIEHEKSHHLYSSCGLVKQLVQVEGSRRL